MTLNEQKEIKERMQALDDHALLRLVAVEASDYRPEALEVACDELRRRRLDVLNAEQYWMRFPAERVGTDGFCEDCRAKTTDESPGDTIVVNFVFGMRLIGHDDRCAACGSVLQTKWLQIVLPIIPLGRYRVIYLEKGLLSGRYVGRRLR
jgi:hypothetical protein